MQHSKQDTDQVVVLVVHPWYPIPQSMTDDHRGDQATPGLPSRQQHDHGDHRLRQGEEQFKLNHISSSLPRLESSDLGASLVLPTWISSQECNQPGRGDLPLLHLALCGFCSLAGSPLFHGLQLCCHLRLRWLPPPLPQSLVFGGGQVGCRRGLRLRSWWCLLDGGRLRLGLIRNSNIDAPRKSDRITQLVDKEDPPSQEWEDDAS
mmetsp:Transcript_59822/g.128930  ORF Transcript_59822/g.128930 Transcript_59822/m.128930 type:complete len:206 (+) Transcript_59822:756-1373(+)